MNALITSFWIEAPIHFFSCVFAVPFRSVYVLGVHVCACVRACVCVCVCVYGSELCLSIDDRNAHLFMSFNCTHCSAMRCCTGGGEWIYPLNTENLNRIWVSIYMSHCVYAFFLLLLHSAKKGLNGETHSHSCAFSIQFTVSVVCADSYQENRFVLYHIVRQFNFYFPCAEKLFSVGNSVSACSCIPRIKVCLVYQAPSLQTHLHRFFRIMRKIRAEYMHGHYVHKHWQHFWPKNLFGCE